MKLIVCEKPDQARQVAAALGGFTKRGMAHEGMFEGSPAAVVACRGHLFMLKEPQEVIEGASWNDPLSLRPLPEHFALKIVPDSKGYKGPQPKDYINTIKTYLARASEVIIATDSDREGEAIGWEVIDALKFKGPIRRAWFSGGTDLASYQKAMSNLYPAERTRSWALASQARSRSDWYYQLLVRAYTYYAAYGALGGHLGRGEDARARTVSVGRVQLPVVKMVFDRDEEIRNFVSKEHFQIKGLFTELPIEAKYSPKVTQAIIESQPPGVTWEPHKGVVEEGKEAPLDRPLFTDKARVDTFKAQAMAIGQGTVGAFSEKTKQKHPPKAFNLMGAQKIISKRYPKLSAEGLQAIVEDLYEQGWVSYPRTEHEDIPKSFYDAKELFPLLKNLGGLSSLRDMAALAWRVHQGTHETYKKHMPKGFSNKEMEHHGLLPTTQTVDDDKLGGLRAVKKGNHATPEMMQFAYLEIAKRYLQMLLPPAQIAEQKISFSVATQGLLGEPSALFKASAEQVLDPGWLAFSDTQKSDKAAIKMAKGATVPLQDIALSTSKTKPPSPYTEISLGEAMSNVGRLMTDAKLRALMKHASGLGTPATRSSIVKTVKARGYLEVKGKNIHCTEKGRDLLLVVPQNFTSPNMTAIWEDYLLQIQEEKDQTKAEEMRDQFVTKQRALIDKLMVHLEATYRPKMQERRISTASPNQKPSPKMVAFAKQLIANSNGALKAPRGMTTKYSVCKEFLDANTQPRDPNQAAGAPSEKQISFAKSLYEKLSEVEQAAVPENTFTDRKLISAFIDQHYKKSKGKKKAAKS